MSKNKTYGTIFITTPIKRLQLKTAKITITQDDFQASYQYPNNILINLYLLKSNNFRHYLILFKIFLYTFDLYLKLEL